MALHEVTTAMWVKACGMLPSCSPRRRVDLLGVQPHVVRDAEQPLEQGLGFVEAPERG